MERQLEPDITQEEREEYTREYDDWAHRLVKWEKEAEENDGNRGN